jgi:hypothetical protein
MFAAFTFTRAEADAEDDEELFDPSDFDDEDAARSERAAGVAVVVFFLEAPIRATNSSALMPSKPTFTDSLLFVATALHNHDAIYLLEGDNVGRGRYPPCCNYC